MAAMMPTIELGLGAVPEAVTRALGRKQGLGVHSGAVGDGIANLMTSASRRAGRLHASGPQTGIRRRSLPAGLLCDSGLSV
jgi:acyl-CoA hydrolase